MTTAIVPPIKVYRSFADFRANPPTDGEMYVATFNDRITVEGTGTGFVLCECSREEDAVKIAQLWQEHCQRNT